MIYHGKKTSTSPGTAVPLSTTRIPAAWIVVFPRSVSGVANTGEVRLGGNPANPENVAWNGASTGIPTGSGIPLTPGSASVVWPITGPNPYDLSTIYLDVDSSGDGIQFVYGRP